MHGPGLGRDEPEFAAFGGEEGAGPLLGFFGVGEGVGNSVAAGGGKRDLAEFFQRRRRWGRIGVGDRRGPLVGNAAGFTDLPLAGLGGVTRG